MANNGGSQFVKHSTIYATGNILRQLAGFIMLPIYTQHLSPADYGIIGLLTFAISLIDLLFGARLVQAVPKFYHEKDSKTDKYLVVSTAMIQTAAISAITLFIVILFRDNASNQLFGSTDYQLVLGIFSITILTQAIENYGLLFLRIQRKAWTFLIFNLSKLICQLSLNIYFVVYLDMGVMGVAISTASVSVLFALVLAIITFYKTGIRYCSELGKRLIIFCWPLWAAGFAGLYIGSANRYYMRLFSSLEDIGLFELATRFTMILTVLIWRPINLYWQTERFEYYDAKKPAHAIYNSVFTYTSTLLIIAGLGISLFSSPVIQLMATESYFSAAKVVPFLVIAAILSSLITYSNFSFLIADKTKWIAKNNYLTMLPATLFYLLLIPDYGFYGAGIAYMLTLLIQFILVHQASKKYFDMRLNITPLFINIGILVAACLSAELLNNEKELIWNITIRAGIFITGLILILGVMLSNNTIRKETIRVITKRF